MCDRRLAQPAVSRTKNPAQTQNCGSCVCVCAGFFVREARFAGRSVRLGAHTIRKVRVLPRQTLSGLKPMITASPRGGVGSNQRRCLVRRMTNAFRPDVLDEPPDQG